jgi:hypothetical protein
MKTIARSTSRAKKTTTKPLAPHAKRSASSTAITAMRGSPGVSTDNEADWGGVVERVTSLAMFALKAGGGEHPYFNAIGLVATSMLRALDKGGDEGGDEAAFLLLLSEAVAAQARAHALTSLGMGPKAAKS